MPTTRHIKSAAAVTLALSAIAAPAASANLPPPDPNCPGCSTPVATGTNVGAQRAIVSVESKGGFDWLDAGIGAAGGIALSITGVGGALALSQRHCRRTRRSTAALS